MCTDALHKEQQSFIYVPNHLNNKEMCNKAVEEHPYMLKFVSDLVTTPDMCAEAVCKDP